MFRYNVAPLPFSAEILPLCQAVVQTLESAGKETSAIQIYPNSFDKTVNIQVQAKEPPEYVVKVYGLVGRVLYEGVFMPDDHSKITLDLSHIALLREELYLISVENISGFFQKSGKNPERVN